MKHISHFSFFISHFLLLTSHFFLLTCCQATPPTIKIGLVAPFEGIDRQLGYEALFAVRLAVQARNAQGGIHGYQIELVALNDFNDPTESVSQARALLADPDVMGVIGHFSSASTLAALPIYQAGHLAVVIPWSIDPPADMTGAVSVAATRTETQAKLATIQTQMGVSHTLTLTRLVDEISLNMENQSLQLDTTPVMAGEILAALATPPPHVFGTVDAASQQLIHVAGAAANGFIFPSPGPSAADLPANNLFITDYQALAGAPPSPRAILAHDATNILLDSLEQVINKENKFTRATVQATIQQITQTGLSGQITFDKYGHRQAAPVWVYKISELRYPGVNIAP
jgi:branched-chain amino acid transport system substrate-binding protein